MSQVSEKMTKTLEAIKQQISTIRTGRANPDLLSRIQVECYGSTVPLKQVANIMVPENMTLQLNVFDRNLVKAIEKAIMISDLNVNPQTDGSIIRIRLPELTEDRRKDLVKILKKQEEDGKIAIRNIRRDFIDDLKKKEKAKEISEDDLKRNEHDIQKDTDHYIDLIEKMVKEKETEILKI